MLLAGQTFNNEDKKRNQIYVNLKKDRQDIPLG